MHCFFPSTTLKNLKVSSSKCNAMTGVIVQCAFWGSGSGCEAVSGLQFSDAQVSS